MPLYQINGYDVDFPHEAYPCQVRSQRLLLPSGLGGEVGGYEVGGMLLQCSSCIKSCGCTVGHEWACMMLV